ncbi:hypothetical protein FXO38_31344 [Capsicum annuum]|nr:hypothetical protein FXO38_31344 [Capsicum annuum]
MASRRAISPVLSCPLFSEPARSCRVAPLAQFLVVHFSVNQHYRIQTLKIPTAFIQVQSAVVDLVNLVGRECHEAWGGQDRRFGSGSLLKKPDRRRPASLDLNNDVVNTCHYSSPRFGVMKKNPITTSRVATFPSPRTPNYRHSNVGIQKRWSSERVQLHPAANRRQLNTALLPQNNGRALPSK